MTQLEQLKEQRTSLIVQRAQAKDLAEMCERRLETLGALIGLLEQQEKAAAPDSE